MGRAVRRLAAGAAVAAAALLGGAAPAGAHALATSSIPAAGSDLRQAPDEVVITFTERPDPALSAIQVLDASGAVRAGGRVTPVPGRPTELEIPLRRLGTGVYTVTWRTVSAVDGHLASGAFAFGINSSPAGAPAPRSVATVSTRPSLAAVGARWTFYLGLMGLVGIAFVGLLVVTAPPARLVRVALPVAWVLGVAGAVGISEAERSTAGISLTDLFSSSLGRALITRGIPLMAALVAVVAAQGRRRRVGLAGAGLAGAAAMLADVDTSHAAATASWTWFRMGTQFAHFLAVGVWIGGLAALLVCLAGLEPEARSRSVRRFSTGAGVGIGVVAATGTLRAVDEVGSWSRLFSTGFGQVVLIKIGLLAVLGVLGAINRFRHVAAARRSTGGMRRIGRAELVVAAAALVAAATLQNLAPASLASAAPVQPALAPLVLTGVDFATTVRIRLTVDPGAAGFNRFRLTIADYDSGAPINGRKVSLRFRDPARPDIGDSVMALAARGAGVYQASGGNLSVLDSWTVTVLIQGAATGVEIPLSVTPQVPPVPITVQHSPGLPDLYNAALAGGYKLQVYLDPGRPGFNQLHSQYFNAAGRAIAITGNSVTEARLPGGSAATLTTRRLGLGHYVAFPTVRKGRYRFVFTAAAPDGSLLVAPIVIGVG